jgi:hypothetical protein
MKRNRRERISAPRCMDYSDDPNQRDQDILCWKVNLWDGVEQWRVVEDALITPQPPSDPIHTASLNKVPAFSSNHLKCLVSRYCCVGKSIKMYASRALRMPILKRSSYYEADYRQSPALIRARRPYLVKNAITGVAIMSFAFGVCELPDRYWTAG